MGRNCGGFLNAKKERKNEIASSMRFFFLPLAVLFWGGDGGGIWRVSFVWFSFIIAYFLFFFFAFGFFLVCVCSAFLFLLLFTQKAILGVKTMFRRNNVSPQKAPSTRSRGRPATAA